MTPYQHMHRERLLRLVAAIPVASAPDGWAELGCFAVGGLTAVGFSADSRYVLVLSSGGLGVLDAAHGAWVARDRDWVPGDADWARLERLDCIGIGPLADEVVRMTGLNGGGLPTVSVRGESLECHAPAWPEELLIYAPAHSAALIEGKQAGCARIASGHILAYGFSWDGESMLMASSSDVTLWRRVDR